MGTNKAAHRDPSDVFELVVTDVTKHMEKDCKHKAIQLLQNYNTKG